MGQRKDSRDDLKWIMRRGHPWVCVRYRGHLQRPGSHLRHHLRGDFPRAPRPGHGHSAVSPVNRRVFSYPFRVPASRVGVSYVLPNLHRRRRCSTSCGTIGVDGRKIRDGDHRLCVSKSVLVRGSLHDSD